MGCTLPCVVRRPHYRQGPGPCIAVVAVTTFLSTAAPTGHATSTRSATLRGSQRCLPSHFHSDHIDGLGELATFRWATGELTPLPVCGPEGVEQVVAGFNAAYSQDFIYRNAHHGDDVAPMSRQA